MLKLDAWEWCRYEALIAKALSMVVKYYRQLDPQSHDVSTGTLLSGYALLHPVS